MAREVTDPREKPTTDVLLNGYVVNVPCKSLFILIDLMLFSGLVKEGSPPPNQAAVNAKYIISEAE